MAWRSWGLDEVDKWLAKHGLVQVAPKFREEEIDGSALEGLCEADVAELLPKMGPRGKFRVALKQLKNRSVEVQNAELSDGTAAQNLNLREQNVPAQIPNLGMQNASAQISSRDVQNVSRLSERTGSIKEKQSTTLQMSKGAQLTIDQLLQPRQSTSFFDDRYAELKKIGFKVFSDSFIENKMPMKQKWYRFWNEEALKLRRQGVQKSFLEGAIKKSWSLKGGRETACCELGEQVAAKFNLKPEHFDVYKISAQKKEARMQTLNNDNTKMQMELNERIRNNTISGSDKTSRRNEIKFLQKELLLAESEYSRVLTNWSTFIMRIEKHGPVKQKRGRKRKQDRVTYKTTKQLKASSKHPSSDDDEVDNVINNEMDITWGDDLNDTQVETENQDDGSSIICGDIADDSIIELNKRVTEKPVEIENQDDDIIVVSADIADDGIIELNKSVTKKPVEIENQEDDIIIVSADIADDGIIELNNNVTKKPVKTEHQDDGISVVSADIADGGIIQLNKSVSKKPNEIENQDDGISVVSADIADDGIIELNKSVTKKPDETENQDDGISVVSADIADDGIIELNKSVTKKPVETENQDDGISVVIAGINEDCIMDINNNVTNKLVSQNQEKGNENALSMEYVKVDNGLASAYINECQNTVTGHVMGSSACTGISLHTLKMFTQEKFTLENKVQTVNFYLECMKEMVNYWNVNDLTNTNCKQGLELLEMKEFSLQEVFWHTHLNVGGRSAAAACKDVFQKAVSTADQRLGILFTIPPDKTFIVLCDTKGDLCLLDSHVHFRNNEVSFEDAVKEVRNRGSCIFATRENALCLLEYIFTSFSAELRASTVTGSMIVLKSKN